MVDEEYLFSINKQLAYILYRRNIDSLFLPHTDTHMHRERERERYTHTHTDTLSHTQTHIYTLTHIHTLTHKDTHTQTHGQNWFDLIGYNIF